MARGNLFLGTAYGSVGDTTFYMRGGKQVSRARRRNVKNPRTERQAINRALLSTMGVAYSYMQGIVDHSFQGRNGKTANMQEFMKQNQGYVRGHVMSFNPTLTVDSPYNFNFKGEGALRPNPYVIARGTLPAMQVIAPAEGQFSAGFTIPSLASVIGDGTTATYNDVCAALGVELGSQLTFCIISDDNFSGVPVIGSNMPQGLGNFHYARVILAPDDGDGTKNAFVGDGSRITFTNANSNNRGSVAFDESSNLAIIVAGKRYPLAAGVIISNYNGRWLRNNCEMVVAGDYVYDNILSDVVDSYMNAAEVQPASDLYLNQSEAPKRTTGETHTLDKVENNDGGSITPVDGVYNVDNDSTFRIFVKGEIIAPVYTGNAVNFGAVEFDRSSGDWVYVFYAIAVGTAEIKIGSVVVNVNVTA